jgi:Tfp pilus assembly protein PilN
MIGLKQQTPAQDRSFLPEDYIERRTESRTNLLALSLFVVVSLGVVGAFLVTSRQWHDVKRHQEAINVRYAQAAKDIEQLKQLEERKESLLQKAELTTALIERVPRSILLAELINRMPADVTILELEVKSTRIAEPTAPAADPKAKRPSKSSKSAKGDAKASRAAKNDKPEQKEDKPAKPVIAPPRFTTNLILVGVTTTHNSVAQYVAELQRSPLLTEVEIRFSEKAIIQEQELNKFRIEARLKTEADARRITPLAAQRLQRDAMQPGAPRSGPAQANTPATTSEEAAP